MKRAILIASANFDEDSGIEPLRFPKNDVTALEIILRSEDFGFGHVCKVIDQANNYVVEQLDELLSETGFDDFILIYFSGHGKINANGELFLSCRNTKESRLNGTGLKYRHVMELLEAHTIDRVAIILDCCYAGRAVPGLKGSVQEQVTSALDAGRGIFVLGASGATQTAEERELDGHGVFTKQIIEGLTTGAADIDHDGRISLNDLAKYVREEFRKKKISQDPIAAGIIKSGDLILGTNRKTAHSKAVDAIRSKIDATRSHFSKATYRAVEDYLDEVSARSDFGNSREEQEFHSLQAFAAGGSIEDVIIAFRRPTKSERDSDEARQAPRMPEAPAPSQSVESKLAIAVSGQAAATGVDRATSLFSSTSKPLINGRVDTRVEAAAQPGPLPPPPVRQPPNEEPPGVGTSSSLSTAEHPRNQTSLRPRLYAAIGILAVLGVGALAGGVYWSQGPESDSKAVPPTQATVAVTPIPAEDQQETKVAPAPTKNVFNAAPTLKWKLQNSYPTNMATTLPFLVKRVGALSDGRMQLEQLPAGAVVPAFQLVDAVSNFLELGYGQGTYLYGKSKTSALMTAVPFGFTTRDHLTFRQRPDTKAAFDELLTGILKLNVVALPCGAFGRSGEFWLKRPLRSKSDLVGRKLRFTGLAASIYAELGSAVTILPGGEIIAAIDRGLIDGGQFANPRNDLDLGFANVLKYYYYPSSVMPAYILDLYINKGKWDAMPPAGRQILEQACGEAVDAMMTEQDRLDREALAEFARRGVNVAPLPAAIERDIFAASEKILTEYRRDPSFDAVMRIVDQMRASTLASKLR